MTFTKVSKRMKKVFTIATQDKIRMAIEWNIVDNIISINWITIDGKLVDTIDSKISNEFIQGAKKYMKESKQYKEICIKYGL